MVCFFPALRFLPVQALQNLVHQDLGLHSVPEVLPSSLLIPPLAGMASLILLLRLQAADVPPEASVLHPIPKQKHQVNLILQLKELSR